MLNLSPYINKLSSFFHILFLTQDTCKSSLLYTSQTQTFATSVFAIHTIQSKKASFSTTPNEIITNLSSRPPRYQILQNQNMSDLIAYLVYKAVNSQALQERLQTILWDPLTDELTVYYLCCLVGTIGYSIGFFQARSKKTRSEKVTTPCANGVAEKDISKPVVDVTQW